MSDRYLIVKPSDDSMPTFGIGIAYEDGKHHVVVQKPNAEPVIHAFPTREEAQAEAAAIAAGVVTLWL